MRFQSMIFAAMALAPLPAAAVTITFEAPTVQNTTQAGTFAVETFDAASAGFGQSYSDTVGPITFSYTGVDIRPADEYGGAGGTGLYPATYSGLNFPPYQASTGSYTLNVTSTLATPIDYFGAWFSAQDDSNDISFYDGDTLIYTFTPVALLNAEVGIGNYNGNPNTTFAGQNAGQAYVFANIYFPGQSYDRVVFEAANSSGTGFETDNQTVGTFIPPITGYAVPEPASWTLMIMGLGLAGIVARRRRALAMA
jgi:hypothetical protein